MSEADRIAAAFLPLEPVAPSERVHEPRPSHAAIGVMWLVVLSGALLLLAVHVIEFPLERRDRLATWWSAIAFYTRTFQFHAGCAGLLIAILFLLRKRLVLGSALAFCATLAVIPEARSQWPAIETDRGPAQLRIFSVNQLRGNRDASQTIAAIRSENPDLIAVQEYDIVHDGQFIEALAKDYPYTARYPFPNCNGLAVFSRVPFEMDREPELLLCNGRAMSLWLKVGERTLRLFNIHPTSPGFPSRIGANRRQMAQLIGVMNEWRGPTVLVGDCNFPLNSQQGEALRAAGLESVDEHGGDGIRWSWSLLRDGPPLVRIDHAFVSRHFSVESNRVLGCVGSDHRPIVVDLGLK